MVSFSHDAPTTPLRQRMQEDMVMGGLGSHTQQDYIRHVRRFATFLRRTPDTATAEDIRRFQLYQHENGVGHRNVNRAAIKMWDLAV
jgi:site-specific recombinase XerD